MVHFKAGKAKRGGITRDSNGSYHGSLIKRVIYRDFVVVYIILGKKSTYASSGISVSMQGYPRP